MDSERNIDSKVISDFGDEWALYNYESKDHSKELKLQFELYSKIVNFEEFDPSQSTAADFGAGTGRWAEHIIEYFSKIWLVEPSSGAYDVLQKKFGKVQKVFIENSTIAESGIPNNSLDFAMSLGVLHHISDTQQAFKDINCKLKHAGVFLGYLYYSLENKPLLYRMAFSIADYSRQRISYLPFSVKRKISSLIALLIYYPLAKLSKILSLLNINIANVPLHHYAELSFYIMRNDALDRFGTKLEKRFNKNEITNLLIESGFDPKSIEFSELEPFWTFTAQKLSV